VQGDVAHVHAVGAQLLARAYGDRVGTRVGGDDI
jgi:hypothetical protein